MSASLPTGEYRVFAADQAQTIFLDQDRTVEFSLPYQLVGDTDGADDDSGDSAGGEVNNTSEDADAVAEGGNVSVDPATDSGGNSVDDDGDGAVAESDEGDGLGVQKGDKRTTMAMVPSTRTTRLMPTRPLVTKPTTTDDAVHDALEPVRTTPANRFPATDN